jgi:transposase-like protein
MNLSNPIYHDADKAREHLEALLWPDGPCCPHCQTTDRASKIKGGRAGLYFCNVCRQQFTVTVGTVFERSKIPLNKWVLATHFMSASKTGVSAHQLHRMLDITYKSAWFMCHRIREAMGVDPKGPAMGGEGQQVQSDETYLGNTSKRAKGYQRGNGQRMKVVALVEPKSGQVRAFRVENIDYIRVREHLMANIDRKSTLVTDEARIYSHSGKEFAAHEKVNHSKFNYVNKKGYTTNHVENFFGIFKRVMKAHIHIEDQHLQRYLSETAFRYSNRKISDFERAAEALKGIEGKRLTYRPIG